MLQPHPMADVAEYKYYTLHTHTKQITQCIHKIITPNTQKRPQLNIHIATQTHKKKNTKNQLAT